MEQGQSCRPKKLRNPNCSQPVLTDVTFSGNTADSDGGMYNYSSSNPMIVNTILWGNTAGVSDIQIYNDETCTSSIQYSDVQGGRATNVYSGGGNIDADPLFERNPTLGADDTWDSLNLPRKLVQMRC
jgi:hypothetical protein